VTRPGADLEPTPRRLAAARARGEVAVAPTLTAALALAAGLLVVETAGATGWRALSAAVARGLAGSVSLSAAVGLLFALVAPVVLVPAGAALLGGLAQTGGLVAFGGLRPRRSGRSVGLFSMLVVAMAIGVAIATVVPVLPRLAGARVGILVGAVATMLHRLAWTAVLAGLAAGAIDLVRVRRAHRAGLRMTRAEVLRERRETEGHPQIQAERARRAAEAAPLAVVVTGDGLAVGLAFAPPGLATPRVVKQPGPAAKRHEDPRLAGALDQLPDGAEIPSALYEEVAALL